MLNSFDYYKQVERPDMCLCSPNQAFIGVVNAENRQLTLRFNDLSQLTFTVSKIEGTEDVYDKLETRRLIFVDKIGWFQITSVVDNNSGDAETKDVTCESHQTQLKARGFSSEERVYKFYNEDDPFDNNYNGDNTSALPSIIGQLYQQLGIKIDLSSSDVEPTEDYKDWTIVYVDRDIKSLCRTFSNETTYGYDFIINKVEPAYEVVFEFDFLHHAIKVKKIENITKPTNIYLSLDNLAENIAVTEDAENIVTVMSCNGSDIDIRTVNPMGTNYLANFDYYKKEVTNSDGSKEYPWMSKNLIDALNEWEEAWKAQTGENSTYSEYVKNLQDAYTQENSISIAIQNANLRVKDLQEARDELNNKKVKEDALTVVERVDVGAESLLSALLFSEEAEITGYASAPKYGSDEKFAFGSETSSKVGMTYEMIEKFIGSDKADDNGEYAKAESGDEAYLYFTDDDTGKSYCKLRVAAEIGVVKDKDGNVVTKVRSSGTVTLDSKTYTITKEEGGVSIKDSDGTTINLSEGYFTHDGRRYKVVTSADGIISVYYFYIAGYSRYSTYGELVGSPNWIDRWESYIRDLEKDDATQEAQIQSIKDQMQEIADTCEVQKYIKSKGDEFYSELQNYWIEGEYTNDTIAALDSTTMSERIDLANELMQAGQVELEKVSQPTFTLAISAVNFLELIEYEAFAKELALGRVVTVERDDKTHYRPALTSIEYDLDGGDTFDLTFSTAAKLDETEMTFADLLNETSSTSRTISANWSNLTDYSRNKENITDLIKNPLDRTLRATQANMSNQEFTIDTTGILGRKWHSDDKAAFVDEQMRISNNTILFTDDNWKTIRTALGKIKYNDGKSEAYGLAAEVLIGSLIMGESLKIHNSDNTISLDENGITIKKPKPENTTTEDVSFQATPDGDVFIKGAIEATSGKIGAITINADGSIVSANKNFSVDVDGNLTAKGGGTIGGYTISDTSLTNSGVGMSSEAKWGANAFWAGTSDEKTFRVTNRGVLSAASATIGSLSIKNVKRLEISGTTDSEKYTSVAQALFNVYRAYIEIKSDYEMKSIKWDTSHQYSNVKTVEPTPRFSDDHKTATITVYGSKPSSEVKLGVIITYVGKEGSESTLIECADFVLETAKDKSLLDVGTAYIENMNAEEASVDNLTVSSLKAGDVTAKSVKVENISAGVLNDPSSNNKIVMTATPEEKTYELEMSYTNSSNEITVDAGEVLKQTAVIRIWYKVVWGTKQEKTNVTIKAGESKATIEVQAFWGVEEAGFFDDAGNALEKGEAKSIKQTTGSGCISVNNHFIPATSSTEAGVGYTLGAEGCSWDVVYARNPEINSSDINKKHDIANLSDKYDALFDSLRPVTYIFNENSSGRTHMGLIAQEVREGIELAGLTTQEVAAYCEWESDEGAGYGLRYGEFIPLNIYEIQKLKKRVTELENELKELKGDTK